MKLYKDEMTQSSSGDMLATLVYVGEWHTRLYSTLKDLRHPSWKEICSCNIGGSENVFTKCDVE